MRISDWSSDVCSSDLALESGSGLGGQMIVERDRGCDRRLVILVPAEPGNRSAVQIQSAVQSVAAGIGRAVVMECFGVVIHVERRVGPTDRKSTRLNSSH